MSYAPTSYCTVALEKKERKKKDSCMLQVSMHDIAAGLLVVLVYSDM